MASSFLRRLAGLLVAGAAACAAGAAPAPAAPAQAAPRIIGGTPAPAGRYPFMAYVEITSGAQRFQCGGSLVAARYVVTAGHCFDANMASADVVVGTNTVAGGFAAAPPANQFPGAQIIRHPAYDPGDLSGRGPSNDVAVLRLSRPAPFAQLRLPRPASDAPLWAPGVGATAIGFGFTEAGTTSDVLREVGLPIVDDAECGFYDGYRPDVTLCAGYETPEASGSPSGRDTCSGDSGGPLLVPDGIDGLLLAGITSYGLPECGRSYAAYAEAGSPALNDFIRRHVPQVELRASPAPAFTGDQLTFTAEPRDPDGSGPFGGYDTIAWDLDGDGVYAEAAGATTATVTARAGLNLVGVRAADGAGNAEVRRAGVLARDPSLVTAETASLGVREGRTFTVGLRKAGAGAGTVTLTPEAGSAAPAEVLASPAPATLTFAPAETARAVPFATRHDRRVGPPRTVVLALGGATGDLRVADPGAVTVTIRDADGRVRLPRTGARAVRRGRFTVPIRVNAAGTLAATAKAGRTTLARARGRRAAPRRRSLGLDLTRRGAALLARDRRVRARIAVTFRPAGGGVPKRARRTVTIRPG